MHPTQKQLLELIDRKNIGELSLRKISELIGGENSAQNIKHHLQQLAKRGLIKIDKQNKRTERIKSGQTSSGLINIPILGAANCGEALIFANEHPSGHLSVSPKVLGPKLIQKAKKLFALTAVGPSMNRANINGENIEEGDYVVINQESISPKNGDYVLSVIDGCANIKKYYEDAENQRIILASESTEKIPPIYIHQEDLHDYMVNGTVVLVMKNPDDLQQYLDTSAKDTFGNLPPLSKKEYEYYKSLPKKK